MIKAFAVFLFLLSSSSIIAQNGTLFIKKNNKIIRRPCTGHEFAFQTAAEVWHKGKITRLTKDSVYSKPYFVQYHMMGTDTISFPLEGFRYSDIAAIPRKGYQISLINIRFQVNPAAGHVHWCWIKSGTVFRIGAAAYTSMMLNNNLSDKDPDKKEIKKGLLTGAGIYLFGLILKKTYNPVHKTGKKYAFVYVDFSEGTNPVK